MSVTRTSTRTRRIAAGVTAAAALATLGACSSDDGGAKDEGSSSSSATSSATGAPAAQPAATAHVKNDKGAEVGTVTFMPEGGAIRVTADVTGLKPGFYGFHVHQTGKCEPPAEGGADAKAFTSAGGHLNPDGKSHPDHAGDMPPLMVGGNGEAHTSFTTDRFTVDQLMGGEGTSVMIHSGADNLANIPDRYAPAPDAETLKAGDSGSRVGCGVVEK